LHVRLAKPYSLKPADRSDGTADRDGSPRAVQTVIGASMTIEDAGETGDVGSGSALGFATARGRNWPTLRQFTVFLENRVGQLLEVVRRFEGSKVRIVALSINDSGECAFVRFLLSHPEQGREILERAGLALIESDLIGVELPHSDQPLLRICTALLQAEVNIIPA